MRPFATFRIADGLNGCQPIETLGCIESDANHNMRTPLPFTDRETNSSKL
jgi:hypothetical protein